MPRVSVAEADDDGLATRSQFARQIWAQDQISFGSTSALALGGESSISHAKASTFFSKSLRMAAESTCQIIKDSMGENMPWKVQAWLQDLH